MFCLEHDWMAYISLDLFEVCTMIRDNVMCCRFILMMYVNCT